MSVFKHHKSSGDRSASDRSRHKKKIEKAIKEGIHNIVAEESIIGQDGKKKFKIPVRGIKEYRFVYGNNSNKKVGSAPGKNVRKGQTIGENQKKKQGKGNGKPGNEKGEEYYEVEISLEELASYLFDSLQLPELEKKQMQKLFFEKPKRHGYRNKGIRPRLDKKETVKRKLRRKNMSKRHKDPEVIEENDEFAFNERDLRYKHIKQKLKQHSNAVIFFLMDISGSMTDNKKYLARSFFFLLYHFVRSKYENTELVFVAHDVQAYECGEDQFFKRGSGGGTMVSSGTEMILEIINKRFHPDAWNIYLFQCSDGDNWPSDNEKLSDHIIKLISLVQLYGYCEIVPSDDRLRWADDSKGLGAMVFRPLSGWNLKVADIGNPEDIWPAFKAFFGGRGTDV